MRQPDVHTNNLLITPSRSYSPQKKLDNSGCRPAVMKDTVDAVLVAAENGEVAMENASPVASQKSEKSGIIGRQDVVVKDTTDAGTAWLNGDVTPATSSGSIFEKKSENPVVNSLQEVVPVESKQVAKADEVLLNGDASSHLIYKKKSENVGVNRYQDVVPVVLKVMVEADEVWQNGKIATETKKRGPLTKNDEQETQIKTLRIEDDDDDVIEERKPMSAENTSEDQDSGPEMFASSRPHAWHHELAQKRHETVPDSSLSRQVCLVTYLHRV